ncbi:MAG: DUF4105 domain-containing protein [Candidatus Azobacteroides sp.]|nr:DUF4105 domain-containing protein [Candidatus Azobacteroides sp.]
MKKRILLFAILISSFHLSAQFLALSDSASISLITCDPADRVYALYGHTALRVTDSVNEIDVAFNYGVFDFDTPFFIYRFAKGHTMYVLGTTEFENFLREYIRRGSGVTEQILNLNPGEKQRIWEALLENHLPQNREYLYNFFYDNCSTRPRILIEKEIEGVIEYPDILPKTTFRKLIHYCNRNHRWLIFGIDLALGAPIDKPIGQEPQLFLPDKLMEVFAQATIVSPDGNSRKLVASTITLVPSHPAGNTPKDTNPQVICWILYAIILLVTIWEIFRKKYFRWLDIVLFAIYGLAGCVVAFLSFISIHPGVYPNYSLIWVHPFHLIVAFALLYKPYSKFVGFYMGINTIILLLFLPAWKILPQVFNPAFLPLAGILTVRSIRYLLLLMTKTNKSKS